MLEKYMAPWGNKVPWINRVIKLEADVLALGKRLSQALAECWSLRNQLDLASEEIEKLHEENYDRFTMPMLTMVGEAMKADVFEYDRIEFPAKEVCFTVSWRRLEYAVSRGGAEAALRELQHGKERASREMAELILQYIEGAITQKGVKVSTYA